MQFLGVAVLQRGVWQQGPIGGYLGPIDGALTPLVAVLAGGPRSTYGVNVRIEGLRVPPIGPLAAHRAEVPLLSRCARAASVKRA